MANRPPAQNQSNNDARVLRYVTANRFYVEMGGEIAACFTSCQGLSAKVKTTQLMEGGVNNQQRILLGPTNYTEVTLSRGITNDQEFWNWFQKATQGGSNIRRNITILVFNHAGETMQSWTLIGAIPVSWKAPQFQATSSNLAIEELALAYEGLSIPKTPGGGATQLGQRGKTGFFG
ncbi:phage tail protein [Pantanalinema rosaneae CENA516]|uniref:phage tail protein n=1 Tax=Pantanalinema rosaneae TaxID=1620701 RepID=UPI003D6FFD69